MILTTSIAMEAVCSYDGPCIQQFWLDTSYKLIGQQDGMASIFESWKHALNN